MAPDGAQLADLAALARHGGPGVALSAAAVALGESRRTITDPKFVQARTFTVPGQVNPAGQAPMFAHVRILGVQPPAPRLHFYDDTTGTGHLVVGYLGPYLPSRLPFRDPLLQRRGRSVARAFGGAGIRGGARPGAGHHLPATVVRHDDMAPVFHPVVQRALTHAKP